MKPTVAYDKPLLVRYLLGQLPDDEMSFLEQRYFAEPGYLELIETVEDELIEEYLDGALTDADNQQFEGRYLQSPGLRCRVELSKAIRTHKLVEPVAPWIYIVAASAALLVVGLGWSLFRVHTLRLERDAVQIQLDQERRLRAEQQVTRPAAPATELVVFFLSPGAERGIESRKSLSVPAGVSTVRLHLALSPSSKAHSYHAVLQTLDDDTIFDWGVVPVSHNEQAVELDLGASLVQSGDYLIALLPGSASGEAHPSYVFHFTKAKK